MYCVQFMPVVSRGVAPISTYCPYRARYLLNPVMGGPGCRSLRSLYPGLRYHCPYRALRLQNLRMLNWNVHVRTSGATCRGYPTLLTRRCDFKTTEWQIGIFTLERQTQHAANTPTLRTRLDVSQAVHIFNVEQFEDVVNTRNHLHVRRLLVHHTRNRGEVTLSVE